MSDLIPVRSASIQGVPARALVKPIFVGAEHEYRSVKEAADVDRELANPADMNHCPLCNDYFGAEAFKAHAQSCINANVPRWERQRDREPIYAGPSKNGGAKRFRPRLFGASPRKGR